MADASFSALTEFPPHHVRRRRIVGRIRAKEANLVDHLDGIVHNLT